MPKIFLWLFGLWMAICSLYAYTRRFDINIGVSLICSPSYPSETGILRQEFTEWLDGLGSKAPTPLISSSPALDCRPDSVSLAFYVSNRDPYWGPRIWAASTLSTELTPGPPFYNFNVSSTDCTVSVREDIYGFDVCLKYLILHHQRYPNFTQCEKKNQTLKTWASFISCDKAIIFRF